MSFKYLGSWISGTMRSEDLIPSFLDLLGQLDPERRTQVELDNPDILVAEEDRPEDWEEQASMFLNECLFEVLNEYAPPFSASALTLGMGRTTGSGSTRKRIRPLWWMVRSRS